MRRRRQPINSINVVPYLDVLLVLLVIFMITAPLFHQGVVDLPSVGEADVPPPSGGAVEVFYKPGASPFSLNDRELGDSYENLSEDELLTRVEGILLLRPEAPLVLAADKDLSHGEVMLLVGKLRLAGAKHIGFPVRTGDDDS